MGKINSPAIARRRATPGEYINEQFLQPEGVTQQTLADALDIDRVGVSAIMNGRRGVTPQTALRLEKFWDRLPAFG